MKSSFYVKSENKDVVFHRSSDRSPEDLQKDFVSPEFRISPEKWHVCIISKFFHGLQEIYQILFILLKTTWQIFCKLCIMHSSGAMAHSRQTFWIEHRHQILIFQAVKQPLLWNYNVCKPWLALASSPLPYPALIVLQIQPSAEPSLLQNQLTIHVLLPNCLIHELMLKYITKMSGVKSCSAIHRFKIK